jgi:hypothetical protein
MRVITFSAILQNETIELQPGFVMEGEPSRERGELRVEAVGLRREPLATTMLPLQRPCGYPGGETALVAAGTVAFPERATGLRVSLDGRVLLEQTAARGNLEVKIEWPPSLSGVESVRWRASVDGCVAVLGYSNDGGETWTPLSLPGPSDVITVDGGALPGGGSCFLELIVTDGLRTQRIRSDAYEVEPKGWVLWILSPAAGARLPESQPVLLAAQGYHLEERRASFDDITWTSSAGAGLGTGARVLAALDPGEQTITASMYGVTAHVAVSVVRE